MRVPVITALLLVPGVASCQILYSVTNSASYSKGAIAQGSIFTVFGYNIGPAELLRASSYPLPLQIAGTSIQVIVGGTVTSCPMIYASSGQSAAILPSSSPLGAARVTLTYNGRTTPEVPIIIQSSGFGIYSIASNGVGPGVVTGADFQVREFKNSAAPGETVILWGTGLGAIEGDDRGIPPTDKQFSNVSVFVGSTAAKLVYAGRSGCCAGLDQIAFELPASASSGCFVPIAVRSGDLTSNFVTLAIHSGGGTCSDALPGLPASVLARALNGEELRLAAAAVGPTRILDGVGFQFPRSIARQLSEILHAPVSDSDVKDLAAAYRARKLKEVERILRKYDLGKSPDRQLLRTLRSAIGMDQQGAAAGFGFSQGLAGLVSQLAGHLVPAGACIVTRESLIPSRSRTRALDAGVVLNFSGPMGQRSMTQVRGQYQLSFGSGFQTANVPSGTYTISGNGGRDIPAFSVSLRVTNSIAWTNKSSINTIDRSQPLTISWAGASVPGYVVVGGSVHTENANTTLVCVEDSAKGSFTIPVFVLSALPAAPQKDAFFFVGPHPFSNPVNIPSLDLAYFANASSDYQAVELR